MFLSCAIEGGRDLRLSSMSLALALFGFVASLAFSCSNLASKSAVCEMVGFC